MNQSVLYIEDDLANIRLVSRLLTRRPELRLRVAMTGREGVRAAVEEPPGLIILDNRLPDAGGAEVLRLLGAEPTVREVPVVVLSGESDARTAAALVAAGAAEFVGKPFDIHQFLRLLDRYFPLVAPQETECVIVAV